MTTSKTISTNLSLRLSSKTKPTLVADEAVTSKLDGLAFYSKTLVVDTVGTFLGVITDFLCVKCKSPILIEFQRVDMEKPVQIYCNSLFVQHGDLGKTWLRVPSTVSPTVASIWYSTSSEQPKESLYVNVVPQSGKTVKLQLKNLGGKSLSLPVLDSVDSYVGLDNVDLSIPTVKHDLEQTGLPAFVLNLK